MFKISFPKKIVWSILIGLIEISAFGQGSVGIGTTSPDQSALLELSSSSQGLLLPRMSQKDRMSITQPAQGLMVYQTDLTAGLYVYDGDHWKMVSGPEAKLTTADNSVWGTSGNTGIDESQHFLGTTDQSALIFKVNNEKAGQIDSQLGNLHFGYKAGLFSKGHNTVALGALSMEKGNSSGNNVAVGFQSMFANENGGHNVAIGTGAMAENALGGNNVAIGSLAGYKSLGSGNVFLGFQSGYSETGDNKLIVVNGSNRKPLIYGDFSTGKLGINTTDNSHTLTVNSNVTNTSGLRLTNLTSLSSSQKGSGKVLSVNEKGEVILVDDVLSPPVPTITTYWKANGKNIANTNSAVVQIGNGLQLTNLTSLSSSQKGSGKVLSVNEKGEVVLVDDEVGVLSPPAPVVTTYWKANGSNISNTNSAVVQIGNGLQLSNMKNMSSKILGLDNAGNVIPVDKPVVVDTGSEKTPAPSMWAMNTDGKLAPTVEADILTRKRIAAYGLNIGWGGIVFDDLNSGYPNPFPSNGLALSLDETGHVILTKNTDGGASSAPAAGVWNTSGNIISTPADQKVTIGTGINSLPEGFALYVKHGILAERVRVAMGGSAKWADYVFEDDYKLMPLNEVEAFIEKNDHLPNVPSSAEVAESGIDMAEMAAKQMEKIEELTLYLIQANKRIDKLEKQVGNFNN